MNVVFLGGGSLRILPIVRALFEDPAVFDGGKISLVDLKLERAEAVGRLIQRCPEYKNVNCQVVWTDDLDSALEGADLFYLTTAIMREPSDTLAMQASVKHNIFHSDNLSINGAFLGARGGGMVMSFARKMEKYCPDAMMLIFANPIASFAAAVTNYTKIKALGICAGFANHRWDLSRICGRDEFDPAWNVESAGVNHLAFILRGEHKGRDYDEIMREYITPDWEAPAIPNFNATFEKAIQQALREMVQTYRRYGTTVFSTEGDGMAHIFTDSYLERQKGWLQDRMKAINLDTIAAENMAEIEKRFSDFISTAASPEDPDWNTPVHQNRHFGIDHGEISVPIIRAMAGVEPMRIAASHPNNGAVAGFTDKTALEYTMTIDGKTLTPAENLYIPAPFHGLISSLAEHQTLLADAIAQQDGKLFAAALDAYPVHRFTGDRSAYFKEMFEIFSDISPAMKDGANYINWQG